MTGIQANQHGITQAEHICKSLEEVGCLVSAEIA